MSGTIFGVGVGPGAPDLLTLRARRVLAEAATVFAPTRAAGLHSLALSVVRPFLDPRRQRIETLPFPVEPSGWEAHTRRLVAALDSGDAAFVTEGDPLLYSSFLDVLAILRARHPRVPVEIVPGIASPMAAAALAQVPLADEDQRLAILPALHAFPDLPDLLSRFDTLVLLKVAPVLSDVLDAVDRAGLSDRAVHVRRVGQPGERILVGTRAIRQAEPEVRSDYFSLLILRHPRRGVGAPQHAPGAARELPLPGVPA